MEEMELEVYGILNKIEKLDSKIYGFLIGNYNEELVNRVIEKMIDMDENNIFKYEYYISNVRWFDDSIAKSLFEFYLVDLKSYESLSSDECRRLAIEINEIVVKLREKLNISENKWISDGVELFLNTCNNLKHKKEIEKLYSTFIYKRNLLVEGNLKFVIYIAKRYCRNNVDICEVIQFGNMGLMRACEKYSPSFNTCFTTYSYHWIKHHITKELANLTSAFCVPYGLVSFNISMRKAINELRGSLKREPSWEEIASCMNEPVEKIRNCMLAFYEYYSLDEPVKTKNNESVSRIDVVVDDRSDLFNYVLQNDLFNDLKQFLDDNLTEKEFLVICHRYELYGYDFKTLEEIGDMFGVTRERIRQIEKKVVGKIRRKGRYLSSFVD